MVSWSEVRIMSIEYLMSRRMKRFEEKEKNW